MLNSRAVERYHGIQERQSRKLVQGLLQDPGDWPRPTKEYDRDSSPHCNPASNFNASTLYNLFSSIGYMENPTKSDEDSASSYLEAFMTRIVHAAIPGSSITDFLPFLASLPDWILPSKKRFVAQFEANSQKFEAMISDLEVDSVSSCFFA